MYDAQTYVQDQLALAQDKGFTCEEAEENILRRMLREQGTAQEVAHELLPSDFSNPAYRQVFTAIIHLVSAEKQVDLVSVDAEMTKMYGTDWRPETLVQIVQKSAYTVEKWQDIHNHVELVRELSCRRKAISSLEGLVAGLRDPSRDIGDTLAEISDTADKIDTGESEWSDMSSVLLATFEYVENRQNGKIKAITTGIKSLDRLIGGFFAEEMTVVAARPSVGKSAFGANVALAAAAQGFKVGIVSCEMSREGLGQRLLSHGAYVNGMELRKASVDPEAWTRLASALTTMSELPISFLFDCNAVEDVVKTVRKKARKGEIDILIVDYLQFMETRRTFKEERLRIGYISHSLKRLARKAHIPVIALAQVTRQGEGQMPTMSMLRESGDIEQDADGIIFLHRPNSGEDNSVPVEDRNSVLDLKSKGFTYLVLGVAKQRNGAVGQTSVIFDASVMRYSEIERVDV